MKTVGALSPLKPRGPALAAVVLAALLAVPVLAQTPQRIPVSEIKPLLVLAVERGSAHGVLTGPGADYMRRRDVQTLHALPRPGCARLEVTTRQRDVLELGKRSDQELRWQISFCRDGSFAENR